MAVGSKEIVFRIDDIVINMRWRIYKAESSGKYEETAYGRLSVGVEETVVNIFDHA